MVTRSDLWGTRGLRMKCKEYRDPNHMGFRTLLVTNESRVSISAKLNADLMLFDLS